MAVSPEALELSFDEDLSEEELEAQREENRQARKMERTLRDEFAAGLAEAGDSPGGEEISRTALGFVADGAVERATHLRIAVPDCPGGPLLRHGGLAALVTPLGDPVAHGGVLEGMQHYGLLE